MKRSFFIAPWLALAALLASTSARADASEAEARATRLFEEGRALARDGRCGEAIPVLLESVREVVGVGPLLNLGHCYEQLGKTASAHRQFVRAAEVARLRQDPRAKEADDRAKALESRLSELTVRVSDPTEPGLALRLDDVPLERSQWSVPARVDPGWHVLAVSSPRRGTSTLRVSVGASGDHAELVVPARTPPPSTEEPHGWSSKRIVGWGIAGTGAAAILVGSAFGVLSALDHGDLVDRCSTYPTCPASRRSELEDLNDGARTKGTIATLSIATGLVLLAGGAALVLLSPR